MERGKPRKEITEDATDDGSLGGIDDQPPIFALVVAEEMLPRENVDDYDVLSYIGYDIEPLTKDERIDRILASGYLDKFSPENQDIIRLLLEAYRSHDIDELTNMRILNMPEFIQKGTPPAIVKGFGGREKYMEMLEEIEQQIYAA